MAYTSGFTAVTGATYTAAQYNTNVRDNFAAVWVGTTAGDQDYYTSSTAKSRLALGAAHAFQKSEGGSAPIFGALVYKRQGGSATNWASAGTTTYTPTATLVQCGSKTLTLVAGNGHVTITYPTSFSKRPVVFPSIDDGSGFTYSIGQTNGSTTSVDIYVHETGGGTPTINIFWLAVGE